MGEATKKCSFEESESDFICIICRKMKPHTDRSDEHVIPDSLNGYYHIFNVCLPCNRNMGSYVDSPLLNFKITQFYRFYEGIKGKKGNIPNPFSEIHSFKDQPNRRVRTEIKNREIITRILPYPEITKNEDGTIKSVNVSVDVRDKHLAEKMIRKILERNNISQENITIKESEVQVVEKPELTGRYEEDLYKYRIGFLKIAYEFAVDSIETYFNDPLAIKISKILETNDFEMLKEIKISNGFTEELFKKFENIINLERKRHILILIALKGKLSCLIKLGNVFHVLIVLSDDSYIDDNDAIMVINDLENKKLIKTSMLKAMSEKANEVYTEFLYFIPQSNAIPALREIKGPNHQLVINDNMTALYKKDGSQYHYKLDELLIMSKAKESYQDGNLIVEYEFPDTNEIFVKSSLTENLFQILGCKQTQSFSKI